MIRIVLALLLLATPLHAQERRLSHCIALAQNTPGLDYVQLASLSDPVEQDSVRITFLDHAMFLIDTAGGLRAITDYNGTLGPIARAPDVATMNNSHESHFTYFPDERIAHVLQGWPDRNGIAADHHLDLGEMLVRNVPTDTRGRFGGEPRKNGNSIFVFEVAGLCIGHLGHLHHEPDAAQYAALGRLDVVMAPVDGGLTLDLPTMIRVLGRLRSSVVIPMHWFSAYSLQRFLDGIEQDFTVIRPGMSELVISLHKLPARPTVMVLEPVLHSPLDD